MLKIFKNFYHHKYHLKYRHAKKLFVFDLCLLALAVVILGISIYLFVWKPSSTDKIDLTLSFNQERILSGENACVIINYKNNNKLKLQNAILTASLPDGFLLKNENINTTETVSKHPLFKLDEIEPGEAGDVKLCGKVWLEPKTNNIISAALTYSLENSSDREQKNAQMIARLPDSVIKTKLETAEKVYPGSEVPVAYTIENTGDDKIENINLVSEPVVKFTTSVKNLTLLPKEKIILTGLITTPNVGQSFSIKFKTQLMINNLFITQAQDEKTIAVFSPDLAILSNFIGDTKYAEPGQNLLLKINWKNQSAGNFQNLKITLEDNPKIIDWKATAQAGGYKIENNKLVIDSKNRTLLGNSTAGAEDEFTVNLKLLPNFGLQKNSSVLTITPKILLGDSNGHVWEKTGVSANLPITSQITWSAKAVYYTDDGNQLGRGTLPPQVGETTKYWILVQINSTGNMLKNLNFTADLPEGVEFTNRQSVTIGPQLKNQNGKITWSYQDLPANTQTGLYFEVAVTPKDNQVGQALTLINKLNLIATDSITNKIYNFNLGALNNQLGKNDEGAAAGFLVKVVKSKE